MPGRALATSIRRTTVLTDDMTASLRFWRDGVGYEIWYDGTFPLTGPALFGLADGTRARVVALRGGESQRDGMIGLMQFLGVTLPRAPREPFPAIGATVILINTDRIFELHDRLLGLGFSASEPFHLDVPDRAGVIEMTAMDPNGARCSFAQQLDAGAQ
jgi:catechol 2,3-dioxygenase-like lactoylglutathione lyase family enzyme